MEVITNLITQVQCMIKESTTTLSTTKNIVDKKTITAAITPPEIKLANPI